jgi:hypothetical protein
MTECLNYSEISLTNILYKKPINKISNIFYNNKENKSPLLITSPLLKIKSILDQTITLEISKSNLDFLNFIKNLDELNISNCYYNNTEWFKKEISLEVIEKYYQTPLNKDTFEIKLDLPVNSDNIIDLDYILDENNEYINIVNLKENDIINLRIKYNGIKFYSKAFKPVIDIKSIKKYNILDNKLIDDTSSELSDDEFSSENED